MNEQLLNLTPKNLWKNFVELTKIPRPSKKEAKVIEFMKNFGESLSLETIVDEVGNVLIRKPATPGMQDRKTVVLQAHLDMVPQKNSDKVHDFEKDPITAYIDGEWVTADGTTLGADNGIGVAAIMAILEAKDIQHPPIEALFTIDEETGMTGAFNLSPDLLTGDILINLDSEDEGELYVGCAGGTNANMLFRYNKIGVSNDTVAYKLALTGLKGGHSGIDINLGRANAAKLFFRFLYNTYRDLGIQISTLSIGDLRNAIPREAFATVLIPKNKEKYLLEEVQKWFDIFKYEYSDTEPNMSFVAEKTDMPDFVIDPITQENLIKALQGTPNGVIRMSTAMKDLVETSTNLSVVRVNQDNTIEVLALIRSSVDTAKEDVEKTFEAIYTLANADKVWFDGKYPGWKPNMNSEILNIMVDVYEKLFGKKPEIKAIHAGLETGVIGGKYPNMDMISIGPTIRHPHSPDEKVHIESVRKFWDFLIETLKHIPKK